MQDIDRRTFVTTLSVVFLTRLPAEAQQRTNIPKVGHLFVQPYSATGHLREAFREGLRELGYVEGQNISIEFRNAEGRPERLPELASELVRLKIDVIVAAPNAAIQAVKQATRTIPIVMAASEDPVGSGFVASLRHPGGNITGVTGMAPEVSGKGLELLKEVVPKLSRVAVLWDGDAPGSAIQLRETNVAARTLGVQVQSLTLRGPSPELESALRSATDGGASALITLSSPLTIGHRTRIAELATKNRLPALYGYREFVEVGGLMAYGASLPERHRRAATYVDKILKGAKPAELPVEQPTKFELVINMKTAKALGLTIPQSLLLRADQLIQ